MLRSLIATAVLGVAVGTAAIAVPVVAGAGTNNGPLSGPMQGDSAYGTDMNVVHKLLFNHNKIKRTVTKLPNGIRKPLPNRTTQRLRNISKITWRV
jgi:hypothetical protein